MFMRKILRSNSSRKLRNSLEEKEKHLSKIKRTKSCKNIVKKDKCKACVKCDYFKKILALYREDIIIGVHSKEKQDRISELEISYMNHMQSEHNI